MKIEFHRLPVFANLLDAHMQMLEALIETFNYPAGSFIFRQNSPADYLYIVLSGKVQISFKPDDGIPITVSHVEPGGLFGWSAVIGSETYTSSAIAIEDLKAIRIHGEELRGVSAENPEAGRAILNSLASAVSARWKDAREQVKLILEKGMK